MATTSKNKKPNNYSPIQVLYSKHEYLAKFYADKIFNFERFGYEKIDIIQEFRIKIYTSIISHSEKWAEYRKTGKYKPVPIEYYLKAAMVNKVKDFIKLFNMEIVENIDKISIESDGFDYGLGSDVTSVISLNDNICEINGIDIFQGLIGRKKTIFSEYISGVSIKEICEKYPMIDVQNVINQQVERLKPYKERLYDFHVQEYSMVDNFED